MADQERNPKPNPQPPREPNYPNKEFPHRDSPIKPNHVEPDREWPKPPPRKE